MSTRCVAGIRVGAKNWERLENDPILQGRLRELLKSEDMQVWLAVMREQGKPTIPECSESGIVAVNAMSNARLAGWNECLDLGESIVDIAIATKDAREKKSDALEPDKHFDSEKILDEQERMTTGRSV